MNPNKSTQAIAIVGKIAQQIAEVSYLTGVNVGDLMSESSMLFALSVNASKKLHEANIVALDSMLIKKVKEL